MNVSLKKEIKQEIAQTHLGGPSLHQTIRSMHNRAACVGHIVDQDGNLVLDISHQNHGGHLVGLLALLVYQGELHIQAIGNRGYTVRITYKYILSDMIRKKAIIYRLAPPASGDTMIEFFHSGMFSLIHFSTAGSA